MSFVRRLALGLLTVALLASAAVAAGYAMRAQSRSGESSASEAPYVAPAPAPASEGSPRPRPAPQAPPVEPSPSPSPQAPRPLPDAPPVLQTGDDGDEVRDLQARLAQLAWYFGDVDGTYGDETTEAVRGFQEKRGFTVTGAVDRRTMNRLHAMTTDPSRDQLGLHNIPGPLDARCTTGRVICIDKSSRTLRWMIDGR